MPRIIGRTLNVHGLHQTISPMLQILEKKTHPYELAAQMIAQAQRIVCFTGAGASTDSGIPDFRGMGNSYWTQYDLKHFHYTHFMDSEESRRIYWKMEQEFYELVLSVRPNAIHDACVELEHYNKLYAIITQNVDSLHQRAGNSPQLVIEIHGNIFSVGCRNCLRKYSREEIYYRIKNGVAVPYCDYCGGILKSDTVSFGQSMPLFESSQSLKAVYASDLFIVIGSSLLVQPAAYLIVKAQEIHSKVLLINLISTPYDHCANFIIYENAERAITKIMEIVRKKLTLRQSPSTGPRMT